MKNFLRLLFVSLIDLVLPQDILLKKLEKMSPNDFLLAVPRAKEIEKTTVAIFYYKNPLMRRAVWEIKFRNNRTVLRIVASACAKLLVPVLSGSEVFHKDDKLLLIPMPLSAKRRRERGYNQSAEIAKEIIKTLKEVQRISNIELRDDILKKVLDSPPQTRLRSRQRRLRNLDNAYCVINPEMILGQNIILLDDVLTTGATMNAATAAIKSCQPRHLLRLAIAH